MQYLYYFMLATSTLYFFVKKRQLDVYFIVHLGISFYFIPCLFGYAAYIIGVELVKVQLVESVYIVASLLLLINSLAAILKDEIGFNRPEFPKKNSRILFSIFFLSVVSFCLMVFDAGSSIFNSSKDDVMSELGRWYVLYTTVSMIGLPLAVYYQNTLYKYIFLFFLLINLLLGFRSPLVLSVLSCVIVIGVYQQPIRIIRYYSFMLTGVILVFSMYLYKYVAFAISLGMWDLVLDALYSTDSYYEMFFRSEPFVVISNLNAVFSDNFFTQPDHILSSIYEFILFAPELGAHIVSFNEIVQNRFFPAVDYGMASTFWGQFWSAGWWLGLIMVIFFYHIFIYLFQYKLNKGDSIVAVMLTPMLALLAFYVHRNELSTVFNMSKRMLIIVIFVVVVDSFISAIKAVKK